VQTWRGSIAARSYLACEAVQAFMAFLIACGLWLCLLPREVWLWPIKIVYCEALGKHESNELVLHVDAKRPREKIFVDTR
jgi:hypothetical protein